MSIKSAKRKLDRAKRIAKPSCLRPESDEPIPQQCGSICPMSIWKDIAQGAGGGVAAAIGVYLRRKNPRYYRGYLLGWVVLLLLLLSACYVTLHLMRSRIPN